MDICNSGVLLKHAKNVWKVWHTMRTNQSEHSQKVTQPQRTAWNFPQYCMYVWLANIFSWETKNGGCASNLNSIPPSWMLGFVCGGMVRRWRVPTGFAFAWYLMGNEWNEKKRNDLHYMAINRLVKYSSPYSSQSRLANKQKMPHYIEKRKYSIDSPCGITINGNCCWLRFEACVLSFILLMVRFFLLLFHQSLG